MKKPADQINDNVVSNDTLNSQMDTTDTFSPTNNVNVCHIFITLSNLRFSDLSLYQ